MRFPSPLLQRRRKPPGFALGKKKDPSSPHPSVVSDVLKTSLLALKESADAFPPLKSVVSGVVAVWDVAERTKHCKAEARAVAHRTTQILDAIADAIPVPGAIPPPMLASVERFTVLLGEIHNQMETIAVTHGLSRFVHLRKNERVLEDISAKLDGTYRDFLAASTLRTEAQHTKLIDRQLQLSAQQAHAHLELKKISTTTNTLAQDVSTLMCYAKLFVLFGSPLEMHMEYRLATRDSSVL